MWVLSSAYDTLSLILKYFITYGDVDVKKVITILALLIVTTGCYASQNDKEKESEKKHRIL